MIFAINHFHKKFNVILISDEILSQLDLGFEGYLDYAASVKPDVAHEECTDHPT